MLFRSKKIELTEKDEDIKAKEEELKKKEEELSNLLFFMGRPNAQAQGASQAPLDGAPLAKPNSLIIPTHLQQRAPVSHSSNLPAAHLNRRAPVPAASSPFAPRTGGVTQDVYAKSSMASSPFAPRAAPYSY